MKKIFTLICALVGIVASGFAQTVADLEVCKHSYVLVGDDVTNNGTEKIAKNSLFGDGYFFTPTGHDKSNKKNSFDLAEKNEDETYKWFNGKYAEYGSHLNSLRLKNAQDVFAVKLTAKSKIIICFNGQSKVGAAARYPKFATDAKLENALNEKPTEASGTVGISTVEYTAPDDMTLYVGSWNDDIYVSYIIVEANEAPGTPSVKVGPQKYENGLWFREVTVKPAMVTEEGSDESFPSVVTYTTDGSAPDANSDVVPSDPIKVYKDQTLKFQAFMDDGTGFPETSEGGILSGAENEAVVSFSFDAPTLTADKGNVTVTTPYAAQGGANVITYGDQTINGDNATLTESAVVSAKTVITNGTYGKFESKSASIDALVLTPIKEKKEIKPIAGEVVIDQEATDNATDGKTYYMVNNGKLNADPKDFFIKSPVFGAVTADEAQYQVPEGQEVYLQMKDDVTIYFELADSALVTITASKHSCKNIESTEAKDKIFAVKVDGTDQQVADITATHEFQNGNTTETLEGNVLKFGLSKGLHKFTRYTGTGHIFLSSIVIDPTAVAAGINDIEADKAVKVKKVIENGQIVIVKGNNKYNVAGAQIK